MWVCMETGMAMLIIQLLSNKTATPSNTQIEKPWCKQQAAEL